MQDTDEMKERRLYSRPSIVGFRVKNPPKHLGNAGSFFNTTIAHTYHIWRSYKIKDIHLITFENTTAFRMRTSDQQYLTGWMKIVKDIFTEANRITGEDLVLEISDEKSEKIKKVFKEMEKDPKKKDLVLTIQHPGLQVSCIHLGFNIDTQTTE